MPVLHKATVVNPDGGTVGVKRGAKKGKKSRKHRRNYRWEGVEHSLTKYRLRHGIGPGYRRDK